MSKANKPFRDQAWLRYPRVIVLGAIAVALLAITWWSMSRPQTGNREPALLAANPGVTAAPAAAVASQAARPPAGIRFGARPDHSAEVASRLTLHGIIATSPGASAIVAIDNGPQRIFSPGQELLQSIRLVEVRDKLIVLEQDGRTFELRMAARQGNYAANGGQQQNAPRSGHLPVAAVNDFPVPAPAMPQLAAAPAAVSPGAVLLPQGVASPAPDAPPAGEQGGAPTPAAGGGFASAAAPLPPSQTPLPAGRPPRLAPGMTMQR